MNTTKTPYASISPSLNTARAEAKSSAGETGVSKGSIDVSTSASGFIDRWRGPVLTFASMDGLAACMNRGGYNAKKVITGWGVRDEPWTLDYMLRVCHHMPYENAGGVTIVRTIAGSNDRGRGYGTANAHLDPREVAEEIQPWWNAHHGLWVELGNEPNNAAWYADWRGGNRVKAEDYVKKWAEHFGETVDYLTSRFPGATFISPGLQCRDEAWLPIEKRGSAYWYKTCQQAFSRAGKTGFHLFGDYDFYGSWAGAVIEELQTYYSAKRWVCTEYGINAQKYQDGRDLTDAIKGEAYANMAHFGRSKTPWPWQVEAATYFHLDMRANTNPPYPGAIQPQYHIFEGWGDSHYKARVQRG